MIPFSKQFLASCSLCVAATLLLSCNVQDPSPDTQAHSGSFLPRFAANTIIPSETRTVKARMVDIAGTIDTTITRR